MRKRTVALLLTSALIPMIGSAANVFTEAVDQSITNTANWSDGTPAFGTEITDDRWDVRGTTEYTAAEGDTILNNGRGLIVGGSGNGLHGHLTISGGSIHIINNAANEAIISAPSATGVTTGIVVMAGGDLIVDNWLSVASRGETNSYGELTIGGGSTVTADEIVFRGLNAGSPVGVVNINTGGTLAARYIWNRGTNAFATVNFDGGTLLAVNDGGNVDDDLINPNVDVVEIKAGGGTIDTAGDVQQIEASVSGTGSLTVTNGGVLYFNSTNSWSGALTIEGNAGVGGSGILPGITMAADNNLVSGTAQDAEIGNGGLTINGDLDISAIAGGSGQIQFQGIGSIMDAIIVTNELVLGSGVIDISDIAMKDEGILSGTYVLISANSISGTLSGSNLEGVLGSRGGSGELVVVGNELRIIYTEGYLNELVFDGQVDTDITNPGNWNDTPVFNEVRGQLWSIDNTTTYTATQGDTTLLFEQGLIVGGTNTTSDGDLTITGGTLATGGDEDAIIADASASSRTGTLTVASGTFIAGGNLLMGKDTGADTIFDATLNVSGGIVAVSNNLKVARTGSASSQPENSTATINVSGGTLHVANMLNNGDNSADVHTFNLNVTGGSMQVGTEPAGGWQQDDIEIRRGSIDVNGGDLTVIDEIQHYASGGAAADSPVTINVENGTLTCERINAKNTTVTLGSGGTLNMRSFYANNETFGTKIVFDGGTLVGSTNSGSHNLIAASVDDADVQTASVIDTSGQDQRIGAPMSGVGSLSIVGEGIYRMNNDATYLGGTTISDGVTLSGNGYFSADVTLATADCGFAPGNAGVGTLNFGGDLDLSAIATTSNALSWAIGSASNANDKAVVVGELDIGTGLGMPSFLFNNSSVTQGQKIVLFEAGSITGSLGLDTTGPLDEIGAEGTLSIEGGTNLLLTITAESDNSRVAEWLRDHGLEVGTENEDPDGDGVDNLNEYAFDGDPTNAAVTGVLPENGLTDVNGTNYFISVHQERTGGDRGIDYNILTTPDLVNEVQTNGNYELLGISPTNGYRAFYTNGIPLDSGDVYFLNVEIEKW